MLQFIRSGQGDHTGLPIHKKPPILAPPDRYPLP
jgi:hypothetical protein